MVPEDLPDELVVIAIGLVVLLAPAVLIALTVGLLVYTGDLILDGVAPIVFFELYFLEIAVFAAFTYVLYWLTKALVVHQLPVSMSVVEQETRGGEEADTRD